jgi:hypothetical protein
MVGLAPEFCSEQILRNRLGTVLVIPQKNVLILPRSTEDSIPKLGMELPKLNRNGFGYSVEERAHSEAHGRVNSEARNGTEFLEKISFAKLPKENDLSVPQKSPFLKIFLKFASAAFCCEVHCCQVGRWPISESHNSQVAVFSSAKCSKTNFESLLLFSSQGMEFRAVFFSSKCFGTKFESLLLFLFKGTEC